MVLANLFLETCCCKTCLAPCLTLVHPILAWEPCLGDLFFATLLGTLVKEPVLRNLAWDSVLPCNLACRCCSNFCLGSCYWATCFWKPVLWTFLATLPGNHAWQPCLLTYYIFKTLLAKLCLKDCLGTLLWDLAWDPVLGNFAGNWQPIVRNLPKNLFLERSKSLQHCRPGCGFCRRPSPWILHSGGVFTFLGAKVRATSVKTRLPAK